MIYLKTQNLNAGIEKQRQIHDIGARVPDRTITTGEDSDAGRDKDVTR